MICKITLEEVQQLLATLEKLLLYEGHPRLSRYDFDVMMELYHMRQHKTSNEDYNARTQLDVLSSSIDKCSPEVLEHLKPFVDKHTYVDTVNYKLSFYDNAVVTIGLLGIILLPIAVVYFVVKLIFF